MKNTCPKSSYLKLMLVMMHAKRTMYGVMEQRKLTPVQGMLLILFEPGKGKTMHGLSALMGCDASNTTGLVDRLEAQGLIERTVDAKDRRVKVIQLTQDGAACRDELLNQVRQSEALDFGKLTQEEIATFDAVLTKLTADLDT